MLKALRTLGIGAWIGCILTLAYQSITWTLTGAWPSLTLLDVSDSLEIGVGSQLRSLPLEYMIKGYYVLATSELSITLWWLGVVCFGFALLWRVLKK